MRTLVLLAAVAGAAWGQDFAKPAMPGMPPRPDMPGLKPALPPVPGMPAVMPAPKPVPAVAPFLWAGPGDGPLWKGVAAGIWGGVPDLAFQPKDRAMEQAEREYERGSRALDQRKWDEAVAHFNEVANLGKVRADAALYWKAYALAKLGRGSEAQAAIDTLGKSHPQSRWLNDAKALSVEISQAAGKPISPEEETDNDIKLMAINALLHTDPERSVPLLEDLLQKKSSPKLRERALFVLSQSNSPRAREVVMRVAKGQLNPDLQMKAIQNLGVYGGKQNQQLLSEIYASSNDTAVKRQILRSYMVSGNREPLLAIAKSDSTTEIRAQAIQLLGAMGASSQLSDLYASESAPEVRDQILRALFTSGNVAKLIEVAKGESDPRLRQRAIQYLGTTNSPQAADALVGIYGSNSDTETRSRVLRALFTQGNAKHLVEIARNESNPDLKKAAVQHLSHMKSKEATDYLLELLK